MTAIAAAVSTNPSIAVTMSEIGLVLLALGIVAYLAVRLSISVVPIYLLIGLTLGTGGIAPLDFSEDFLTTGAWFGAILLLLMLGLEHSAPSLIDGFLERKSTGIIDLLINGAPGAIAGLLMGWGVVGAIALGGITFVSSSGIASQLMKESGWQRSEVSRRVTTVLVVEDLTLAPYLPFVSGLIVGIGVFSIVSSMAIAVGATALAIFLSFKGQNVFRRVLGTENQVALLLTVFGAALLVAGGAEMVGFSSAVAAFLVGLLLTGEVAEAVRRRLSPLRDLFAAVFFVFFGLGVDPAAIPPVLPVALALAIVGVAGKLAVGWYIARQMTDQRSWIRAGAFLTPRGEFSLLIAGLAASTFFGEAIQAITITYVFTTTLVASLILRFVRSPLESDPTPKRAVG